MSNKTGRLWRGGANQIDEFVTWVYDKMNKTDQNKKDVSCRRYYRYYNDGDMPHGMTFLSKDERELKLEEKTTTVILSLFKKYNTVARRRECRAATKATAYRFAVKEMSTYWVNKFVKRYGNDDLLKQKMSNPAN